MDKKDILILQELDLNARNSYGNIGKKIHKSKEFVRARVQKLVENKVIARFVTSIDYSGLGMYRICLYIKFKEMTPKLKEKILSYDRIKQCRIKFFSVGNYDLYIDWILSSEDNAAKIAFDFLSTLGDSMSNASMHVLYKIKHYRNRYLYNKAICPPFISEYTGTGRITITKQEEDILNILKENPRINIVDLAKQSDLSVKTVLSKINHLKKLKILKGFCIKLNNVNVNKEDYIILLKLNNNTNKTRARIESYLDSIIEVSYLGRLIGEYDLEFAITVNSQREFIKIFEKLRSTLKQDIKEFNILFLST